MDTIEPPKRLQEFAIKIMSGLTNQQFKIVSFLVVKGRIISWATNDPFKTSPAIWRLNHRKNCHSEYLTLRRAPIEKIKGSILYVFRLLNCRIAFAMSRPCETCQSFIREANLKKIIYTTSNGTFAEMRI